MVVNKPRKKRRRFFVSSFFLAVTGELDRYNVFTAILLIKHSEDGYKYLHDITTIKKETSSPLEQ